MEDRPRRHLGDDRLKRREIDDVEHPQIRLAGNAAGIARREVVDHRDLVALGEEGVNDV